MNRKLQRTTDAAIKGVNYIDGELAMWGEKYSNGGAVPKSVKRRVTRLVEARKVAIDMQNEKEPLNDIEKKMLDMEKSA
jgi:hypothetical protein